MKLDKDTFDHLAKEVEVPQKPLVFGWVYKVILDNGNYDYWAVRNKRELLQRIKDVYTENSIISCERIERWTGNSVFRMLVDGRLMTF